MEKGGGRKDLSEGIGRKWIDLSNLAEKGDAMKKFIVCIMIFTLVFTGYCFSSSGEVRADEGLKVATVEERTIDEFILLMEDVEVIDEIILSMEDGQMDIEEIENLATIILEKSEVDPDWDAYYCTYHLIRALVYLITFQFNSFQYHLAEALVYCTLGI